MTKPFSVSLIIPAYNEEKRLPLLFSQLERLKSTSLNNEFDFEVIFIDDGSTDNSYEQMVGFSHKFENTLVIRNKRNRKKGFSVRRGVFAASGDVIAYLDSDGSADPIQVLTLIEPLRKNECDVIVGSRALHSSSTHLQTRKSRELIGFFFRFLVKILLFSDIKDTQCGFKMFRRQAALDIFSRCQINGFAFDLEVLYLSTRLAHRIREVPISWSHVDGSKINLVFDSISMLLDLLRIKFWHYSKSNKGNEKMLSSEYELMNDIETKHWWFRARQRLMLDSISFFKYSKPAIIDIGTGTGANLNLLSERGNAIGIDTSEDAVNLAKRNCKSTVVHSPLDNNSFPNESFDIAVCLDVLEHLDNPFASFHEIARLLRTGGRALITVPAYPSLWSHHDECLAHFRRYTKASLLAEAEESGLHVDKCSYFYMFLLLLVAPYRLIRRFQQSNASTSDTDSLPPQFINNILVKLMRLESNYLRIGNLPAGTTLFAVLSKQ